MSFVLYYPAKGDPSKKVFFAGVNWGYLAWTLDLVEAHRFDTDEEELADYMLHKRRNDGIQRLEITE